MDLREGINNHAQLENNYPEVNTFRTLFFITFVITLGLFCLSVPTNHAYAAISFVQTNSNDSNTAASTSATFTSTLTAGDEIFAIVAAWNGTITSSTMQVSDSLSQTWQCPSSSYLVGDGELCYVENTKGGADTVNFNNNSASTTAASISIFEYSGLSLTNSFDIASTTAEAVASSGVPYVTPPINTTNANDLIFSSFYEADSNPGTITVSSPFILRTPSIIYNQEADLIATSTGTYNASFTHTYGNYAAVLTAAFKEADILFRASPTVITSAGTSTLSWSVINTSSSITITPGSFSTSTSSGSLTVNPTSTTLYTITATNANGTSTATTTVTVASLPPSVPTGISPSAINTSQIQLSWNPSPDPYVSSNQISYTIYRNGTLIATTTPGTTSYIDTGLTTSTTYAYAVSASDAYGNTSAISPSVNGTTMAYQTIAYVESTSTYFSATTGTLSFPSNVSAGGFIIAVVDSASSGAGCFSFSVTDSLGNTYVMAATSTAGGGTMAIFYAHNSTSGPDSVHFVDPCPNGQDIFAISEYTGIASGNPIDVTNASTTSSGTTLNTGSSTTTNTDELLFSQGYDYSTGPTSSLWTVSSGWTKRESPTGGGAEDAALTADRIVFPTSTYSNTFGNLPSGNDLGAQIVTFKGAIVPPLISWTTPSPNATISSTPSLTVSVLDNVSISSTAFSYGSFGTSFASSTLIGSTSTPSGTLYTVPWNTTPLSNGSTTLWAFVTNSVNETSTASTTVNVENPHTPSSTPRIVDVASGGTPLIPSAPHTPASSIPPSSTSSLSTASSPSLQSELQVLLVEAKQKGIIPKGFTISAPFSSVFAFTRDLFMGMRGLDIKALQHYLNTHGFPVASPPSAGSIGHETEYFGPETKKALALFQEASGISPHAGYFGPITRAWMSGHE